jgi:hypothetical protein
MGPFDVATVVQWRDWTLRAVEVGTMLAVSENALVLCVA